VGRCTAGAQFKNKPPKVIHAARLLPGKNSSGKPTISAELSQRCQRSRANRAHQPIRKYQSANCGKRLPRCLVFQTSGENGAAQRANQDQHDARLVRLVPQLCAQPARRERQRQEQVDLDEDLDEPVAEDVAGRVDEVAVEQERAERELLMPELFARARSTRWVQ
jgi:hypothetical protein